MSEELVIACIKGLEEIAIKQIEDGNEEGARESIKAILSIGLKEK